MVFTDSNIPEDEQGRLVFEKSTQYEFEVFFIPPEASLVTAGIGSEEAQNIRVKLMGINSQNNSITIYPTDTRGWSDKFLKPKYNKIKRITIAGSKIKRLLKGATIEQWGPEEAYSLLKKFPSVFTTNYNYGLGIEKDYRFIIDSVETISNCSEVVITGEGVTHLSPDGRTFYITKEDFEWFRLELNRITSRARDATNEAKRVTVHNALAERIGVPKLQPNYGRHPQRKIFTDLAQGKTNLSEEEQSVIISAISSNATDIVKSQPEKLVKLHADIELVTLAELIKRFEEMMKNNLSEQEWQFFLNENPFILSLAFSQPVIISHSQASVGGMSLSGTGNSIVDFLVQNRLTHNAAIVEIKTHKTVILNKNPIRQGVYTPSSELSGSINQVLDQRNKFQRNISQLKTDGDENIETHSVRCYLIIGSLPPDGDKDKSKSFDIFRGNSRDVEIITFDELLEKLKSLHHLLSGEIPSENP